MVVDIQKQKIRNIVSGVYDIQKLRVATGNRIVQSFNIQMGQSPSTSQEDMDKEAQKLIAKLRDEYRRITDAYVNGSFVVKVKDSDKKSINKTITVKKHSSIDKIIEEMHKLDATAITTIKSKLDYELIGTYVDLLDAEERMNKILAKEVEKHPMWDAFFKGVDGCGPLMAAVCLAYFDIDKARHVSSFWKYAGLDTVEVFDENGISHREGRSMRHTEVTEYTDKDGNVKQKRGITYNPELKTKLVGVLGSCMLKVGVRTLKDADGKPVLDVNGKEQKVYNTKYAKIYADYRNRLDNRNDSDKLSDLRKFKMANRYMVKQFIRDLWVTWRAMAGYEVSAPYEVVYLGRKPHKYNEYHNRVANDTKEVTS